jgi:HAD superfamily hydrolase (TIGR01484 family)
MTNSVILSQKRVIMFDLDGTLSKSKSSLDKTMASLIVELLRFRHVAVVSGGAFQQFKTQFLSKLPNKANLQNLFLFPTSSASGYYYDSRRHRFFKAYNHALSKRDAERIIESFQTVFKEIEYTQPKKTYGPVLENRGSQLTFSALGQEAPLRLKQRWDPKQKKRLRIRKALKRYLPEFEISIGGTTSIDVTRNGVNKTLCVKKLTERLGVNKRQLLYVGDALFRGGNDYIMRSANITCMPVSNPEDTRRLIQRIINNDPKQEARTTTTEEIVAASE